MTALWHLTGPKIPTDEFSPQIFDTIVVGAGLTGMTTAVLLARAGQRVAVVEAGTVGSLTTGHTTGKLSLLQGTVFSSIVRHAGSDAATAYADGNREGQAWLLRFLAHRGIPFERRDAFTYAVAPADVAVLERERDSARQAGVAVTDIVDPSLPFSTAGALQLPDQAQLHPMRVLAALSTELRDRGSSIVESCRVHDVDRTTAGVTVHTNLGGLTADVCVLATGAPILDRGLFFAKLESHRSFAMAFQTDGAPPPRGMYVSVGEPQRSLRTAEDVDGSELIVVGGGDHITGRSTETAGALADLEHWARRNLCVGDRVTWWGAQDYRAHDALPYAGRLPRGGGRIFTATGYQKWGMTNAVAAALTIASDLLGGRLDWAETLRDHALRVATVADAAQVEGQVAAHAVTGWAGALFQSTSVSVTASPLGEGDGRVSRNGATPIGTSRNGGQICRVSAVCPHLGGVLSWNRAERSWDCPLHGSRFDADGVRIEGPALEDLKPAPDDLKTYNEDCHE